MYLFLVFGRLCNFYFVSSLTFNVDTQLSAEQNKIATTKRKKRAYMMIMNRKRSFYRLLEPFKLKIVFMCWLLTSGSFFFLLFFFAKNSCILILHLNHLIVSIGKRRKKSTPSMILWMWMWNHFMAIMWMISKSIN